MNRTFSRKITLTTVAVLSAVTLMSATPKAHADSNHAATYYKNGQELVVPSNSKQNVVLRGVRDGFNFKVKSKKDAKSADYNKGYYIGYVANIGANHVRLSMSTKSIPDKFTKTLSFKVGTEGYKDGIKNGTYKFNENWSKYENYAYQIAYSKGNLQYLVAHGKTTPKYKTTVIPKVKAKTAPKTTTPVVTKTTPTTAVTPTTSKVTPKVTPKVNNDVSNDPSSAQYRSKAEPILNDKQQRVRGVHDAKTQKSRDIVYSGEKAYDNSYFGYKNAIAHFTHKKSDKFTVTDKKTYDYGYEKGTEAYAYKISMKAKARAIKDFKHNRVQTVSHLEKTTSVGYRQAYYYSYLTYANAHHPKYVTAKKTVFTHKHEAFKKANRVHKYHKGHVFAVKGVSFDEKGHVRYRVGHSTYITTSHHFIEFGK